MLLAGLDRLSKFASKFRATGGVGVALTLMCSALATAADPPPDPGMTIVLDTRATSSTYSPSLIVTNSPQEYDTLLSSTLVPFQTSQIIVSSTPQDHPPFGITNGPLVTSWVTVYDQSTLDAWNAGESAPGYLSQLETYDVPDVNDAAFDIDTVAPRYLGVYQYYHAKIRVRKLDGAVAVVYMIPVTDPVPEVHGSDIRCNAGFWWDLGQFCCWVSGSSCQSNHRLFPRWCNGCEACAANCYNCAVNNPCHSCDPCGMMWLYCRLFGHC